MAAPRLKRKTARGAITAIRDGADPMSIEGSTTTAATASSETADAREWSRESGRRARKPAPPRPIEAASSSNVSSSMPVLSSVLV